DAGFTSIGIDFTPNVHADTVNIQSVNEATTVLGSNSLTGNTFNVSSNAPTNTGNLLGIKGTLTFTGSGNNNRLTVSDFSATSGNSNVVVGSTSITGFAGPTDNQAINYSGSYSLIRLLGSNNVAVGENFTINSPGGPFQLDANAGNDTANLQAASAS